MVKAQKEGLVRNIGVSNYTVKHLKELFDNPHGVLPAVNQVSVNICNKETCYKRVGIRLSGIPTITLQTF